MRNSSPHRGNYGTLAKPPYSSYSVLAGVGPAENPSESRIVDRETEGQLFLRRHYLSSENQAAARVVGRLLARDLDDVQVQKSFVIYMFRLQTESLERALPM